MNKIQTKKAQKVSYPVWLRHGMLKICRLHFIYAGLFAVQLFIYDAGKLLTPEVVMKRWIVVAILAGVTALLWYLAHNKRNDVATYKRLVFALIAVDIAVACFMIYTQRGMASRGVFLYIIPISVSAILLSPSALIATAAVSLAAYIATAVSYFVLHFNEGYKLELYGEVGFYAACFVLCAALLSSVVKFGGSTADR